MDELEEIRRRRLEEYKRAYEDARSEQNSVQQQVGKLEAVARNVLTKDAFQRYSNIKLVDPEKAVNLLVIIAQAAQRGVKHVDDEELKELLKKMNVKRDFTIRRI